VNTGVNESMRILVRAYSNGICSSTAIASVSFEGRDENKRETPNVVCERP
jgi:hypothetical protein